MVSSLVVGPKWILDKHWRSKLAHWLSKAIGLRVKEHQIKKVTPFWRNCLSVVVEGKRPRWVGLSVVAKRKPAISAAECDRISQLVGGKNRLDNNRKTLSVAQYKRAVAAYELELQAFSLSYRLQDRMTLEEHWQHTLNLLPVKYGKMPPAHLIPIEKALWRRDNEPGYDWRD